MKVDNKKFDFSLNDTSKLRQLIIDNPDLPLLIFCGEDSWHDFYSYEQADVRSADIQYLTLYGDVWRDEDDYSEELANDLCDEEEYKNLSDEEFNKMIDDKVKETDFAKVIAVYIG